MADGRGGRPNIAGGRAATVDLAERLALAPSDRVLDIGCGIGGAERCFADAVGCDVTGIDLTAEYVAAAAALSGWVGLGERTAFEHASALAMPFGDATFDAATMLCVGMNIAAKAERNRRDWALGSFRGRRETAASADGAAALGIHIVMGDSAGRKIGNMVECITAGIIVPVEMIAPKPG